MRVADERNMCKIRKFVTLKYILTIFHTKYYENIMLYFVLDLISEVFNCVISDV